MIETQDLWFGESDAKVGFLATKRNVPVVAAIPAAMSLRASGRILMA